jgi:hypothetical protein
MSATCGAGAPSAVSVPIQNTGDGPLVINASATGGFVITSALPMTIAAGGSASLGLRPPTAVVGSDVGGSSRTGTLTITTNEVTGATHQVNLSSTVFGANLQLVNAAGAPITSIAFNAAQACPARQTVFVRNTGNAPASIAIPTQNFQLFQWSGFEPSASIPGGSAVSHVVGVFTVNQACTGNQTVQYAATGPVCTMTPISLPLSFNITGQATCFCS